MDDRPSNALCPRCAASVSADARFCSRCGSALPAVELPAVAAPAGTQRRRVTVLFADMTGFTEMTARHDPEDVRAVVDRYLALAREAVERWGGRVDQYLGDGVMAVFGDQVTREDDAERAVRAALDIRGGTPLVKHGLGPSFGTLTAHIGLATGIAVTAEATHEFGVTAPLGTVVNLAARLQALASAGEVLVCGATAALTDASIATTSLGPRALKGIEKPVEVHRVDEARRRTPERPVAGLVGRARERGVLADAVEALAAGRPGNAIVVVAEAGAGKTRLVREIRTSVLGRHGTRVTWLEGRGSSMRAASPFAPVVEILHAVTGVGEADDTSAVSAGLHDLVDALGLGDDDVLGPLLRLVGHADPAEAALDRESYQARLSRAVVTLLRALARRSAVVVCMQDLHWFDPSSTSLIRSVIPDLRSEVLFVLNSRVEPPSLAGIADVLRLDDLGGDEVADLVAARLDGRPDPALAAFVYERAGGNPFFVEEVVNRLVDEDAIERRADGWALRPGSVGRDVPDTVQGVIAARLDLLSADARTRLRHAAVFGRTFTVDDLLGVDPLPSLAPTLAELIRSDLVRPDADGRRYEFKHALTLDVARSGLAKPERRRLHLAAARSIEQRLGERATDEAEVVGSHYLEAGEVEPTVRYLGIAAERALDRYAIDEADTLYGSAYRLLVDAATPDERRTHLGPLLVRWVLVHYYRGTWRQATDLLALHDDDITASDDRGVLGMALAWRGFSAAIARAAIAESLELLDRAVAIGEEVDDAVVLAHAHTWRIWARFLGGQHDAALADGRRVDALLARLDDPRYPAIKSAGAVGLAQIGTGAFGAARETAEWLIATGAATGSTRAASMGESVLSLAATLSDDAAGGAEHGRRAVAAATDPIYRDMARLMAVHGMVAAGQVDAARAVYGDLVESCVSLGLDGLVLAAAPAHGVIRVLDGELTAGMDELDDAIDRARSAGSEFLASLGRLYRATVRARSATREVTAPLRTVIRNPRFVARHAVPARRSAADELETLIGELAAQGGAGLRWLASIELAKVLVARGDRAGADRVLTRALAWTPDVTPMSGSDVAGA